MNQNLEVVFLPENGMSILNSYHKTVFPINIVYPDSQLEPVVSKFGLDLKRTAMSIWIRMIPRQSKPARRRLAVQSFDVKHFGEGSIVLILQGRKNI